MDAIISANKIVVAFHLFREITNAAIAETRIVRIVALIVIISEFPNTCQKFIRRIALGKFRSVKPCAPISASGFEVISPFVLNTLITTRKNGKMNIRNTMINIAIMIPCVICFLRKAFSLSVIMLPPRFSYRSEPALSRQSHR